MKILICMSNVPDTTTKIRFVDGKTFDAGGVQWIINPWDELALTRALQLKEMPGSNIEKISIINVGGVLTEATLRKALAIGADDAVRINTDAGDSFVVASQIAWYVKNNPYDLIICGIESSDYNSSAVGGMVAEALGYASVSSVSSINTENGVVSFKREIDGGSEMISCSLPCVAIIQKGVAFEPRIPSMRGIMDARRKPLVVVEPQPVDALTEYTGFELPAPKASCRMVEPENVRELVDLLHKEARVI